MKERHLRAFTDLVKLLIWTYHCTIMAKFYILHYILEHGAIIKVIPGATINNERIYLLTTDASRNGEHIFEDLSKRCDNFNL